MKEESKKVSILNFANELKDFFVFNPNQKYIPWGTDNKLSDEIIKLYDTVPEHSSSINFSEQLTVGEGLINFDEIDIWTLKKIVLDYLLFGGFTIKVNKLRNGNFKYEYFDISKCRFNPEKDQIGYSDEWYKTKVKLTWYPLIESVNDLKTEGVYYFKNNKSREVYPRPHYLSAFKTIDTASTIASFHNAQSKNGFVPNTVINFNNGISDPDKQEEIEREIKEKFCGPDATRFILSFNANSDESVSFSKLENDNMDTKFETLQKWCQNEITIAHQITSNQLIGVKAENQGFSKTEYLEAIEIFKRVTINSYRIELEYAFSKLTNKEVKFIEDETIQIEPSKIQNNIE